MLRHTRSKLAVSAVATILLAGLAAGCGDDDDGAGVRDLGGEEAESGSASAPTECRPVGDASTADSTVEVLLGEWYVTPEASEAAGPDVHFAAVNEGEEPHEIVVVRTELEPDALPTDDTGRVDEEQLPEGALIGEIEGFPAGLTCDGTFEMEPGDYVLFCNLVTGDDDVHYELGMTTGFTVS